MPPKLRTRPEIRQENPRSPYSVFLNIPYDSRFESLYLAYIAAISAFGLVPRATLEIPGGRRRLDRIFDLVSSCQYSVHDLSRVELDRRPPSTPRFNMPFELGIAVAWEKISGSSHVWFVCESHPRRLQKSLSDLDGTEVYIHKGKVDGLFGQLCSAFVRSERQPTVGQMRMIYRTLRRELPILIDASGADSAFEARVFKDLCVLASSAANLAVP